MLCCTSEGGEPPHPHPHPHGGATHLSTSSPHTFFLAVCVQILDSKHPGCTIRQIVAGPITDTPTSTAEATEVPAAAGQRDGRRRRASRALSEVTPDVDGGARFSHRWKLSLTDDGGDDLPDGGELGPNGNGSGNGNVTGLVGDGASTIPSAGVEGGGGSGGGGGGGGIGGMQQRKVPATTVAPGWDGTGAASSSTGTTGFDDHQAHDGSRPRSPSAGVAATATAGTAPPQSSALRTTALNPLTPRRRQAKPVSADGERSFLEAFLDGGHSPATAIAAGFDPAASARGVAASVVAEAVTVEFVGATVVLGPVVGRVTQRSAVVLLEVGSTAAVGCVLTDGVTGGQHRQA